MVGAVLVFVAACSGTTPPKDLLGRTVATEDPGWNQGKPQTTGVSLERFAAALDGKKEWKEQGKTWVLALKGPVPGSQAPVETIFTLAPSEKGSAVFLREVRRGTKSFSKSEIWAYAADVAKRATEKK